MRTHLALNVHRILNSWKKLVRRWNAVPQHLNMRTKMELQRLENREAPSDTLSALLGLLGASQLMAGANFDLPAVPQQSFGQSLSLSTQNLPSPSTDFTEPMPTSAKASPRPLTQWLNDNLGISQGDNISLDDGTNNAGSGAGIPFQGSFSAGLGADAGLSASSAAFSAPITGFSGGPSFSLPTGTNSFDGLPQSNPPTTSNTNSTNSTQNTTPSNSATSQAEAAAANLLASSAPSGSPSVSGVPSSPVNLDGSAGSDGGSASRPQETPIFVTAPDAGSTPVINVYSANLSFQYSFNPFPGFHGGVRVAVGDLTGTGHEDIIAAAGPGGGSQVKVFDGSNGNLLFSFNAFVAGYTDGVYVATGNLAGNGKAEIIVGTDVGSTAPMVKVFDGSSGSASFLFSVMADGVTMHGGVRVAAGDVKNAGHDDIITADGPGGPPRVGVFDGLTHKEFYNFFAADPSYTGGIYVAAGDVEGTGNVDIVTGTGSNVQVFRGSDDAMIDSFQAFDSSFTGGARVTTLGPSASGVSEIAVGTGVGNGLVRIFDARSGQVVNSLQPYGSNFSNGLFVAGVPATPTVPGDPLDTVTMTADATATTDIGGAPVHLTFTRTGDLSQQLVVRFNYGGTAVYSFDFTASGGNTTGSVLMPVGVATAVLTITPQNDEPAVHPDDTTATLVVTIVSNPSFPYNIGTPNQAVISIIETDFPPAMPPDSSCGCSKPANPVQSNPNVGGNVPSEKAITGGVDYATGAVDVTQSSLSSDNNGTNWGFDWNWSNDLGSGASNLTGNNTAISELPYLLQNANGDVEVISNGTSAELFNHYPGSGGGTYQPQYFLQEALWQDTANKQFNFTDTNGDQIIFNNFDSSLPAAQQGQLKSYTDPGGNTINVVAYTSTGQPAEEQRSSTVNGTTVVESYLYTYGTSGASAGKITNVTLRRQTNGGAWVIDRQLAFTYYDGSDSNGTSGDLKLAQIQDASGNILDTYYYRYYTTTGSGRNPGDLKFVFNTESYGRLVAAVGNPDTATDSQVAPYADKNFQYDSVNRVTSASIQGAGCSSCAGGIGTFSYTYTPSAFANGYNNWSNKTVETQPDGTQDIVYTNFAGEVMLTVFKDTSGNQWLTFNEYDNSGRLILTAQPSAVSGFDDTTPDLLNNQGSGYQYLNNTTGLIDTYAYGTSTTATSSTAGSVLGYLASTSIQQGQNGTPILQSSQDYFAQSVTVSGSPPHTYTFYPLADSTRYHNTDGTGAETTSYAYTFFSNSLQVQSETTTLPVISSSENGPGVADASTVVNDQYGRPIWTKDADGFINYTQYDQATGAVVKTITDVNTTRTSDFSNLPAGWSTPAGGGLHLITNYQVDQFGRTTLETDPNGNLTYTTYDDVNHVVRTYRGWNSSTNTPTGPTEVYREDRAGGYTETLTMSATPHLTNGVPDGTEAIGNIQTLSRSYTNAAGQVIYLDVYFNLTGLTYSTSTTLGMENVNFYRTRFGYDDLGRQNHVQTPTGTITDTVFDSLGRVSSTWVGTNDTPTSGEWSPTNNGAPCNMIEVSANAYDGGGIGDSNLTQETQIPGGSDANRVTQNFYDWRDRLVATKSGVQATEDTTTHRPIIYRTFDNLDEVTRTQQFDGDGVTITSSNGVPNAPSASLLRAQSDSLFDDQGRVYETKTYSVDPSTGSVSANFLATNNYYNHRGMILEAASPVFGGPSRATSALAPVMKYQYDGAGRTTITYTTDGASGAGWSNAGSVGSDNVLGQTENTYDGDGNVIETIDRQRFHDQTTTGGLGTPTAGVLARVYYTADYYDAANRTIASVDVGTNGGSAWTRPSSVPSPSDTVLVTSTLYNSAGWVDSVTDPKGIVNKKFYDNLGQVTKAIQDYTNGTPTNSSDKTTEFTYDGDGHMLTLQADLVGGAYEQTKWIYGTSTSTSDSINSNDILKSVQYPDPTTGNPSSSQQETYTVNELGQIRTYTDRNGNVHSYTYDVLGRQTSDAVTTLGTGVDGSVRRIDTAYDTQGNAYLFTSYSDTAGATIVNQVQRAFNGLGQLTQEWQSYSGAVSTSSTPSVQYGYSLMAGGANHSRLTSMIYPNGRMLNFNYNAGVDDAISRLSSISDSSGILESYNYLGLDTVVIRNHPQPGVELTFVKLSGEANGDAGDQYTGSDRFGRVVNQRWIVTATGSATDWFQYSYDRDGNVLTRNNLLNSALNETYSYDNLNQLTNFARGSHTQSWAMDAVGNFLTITTDGTPVNNTFNKQNEETQVGSANLSYDANGNMTVDQSGNQILYDAWNRMTAFKNFGGTVLETFSYDVLNRRVTLNPGTLDVLYYSAGWQVLEERVNNQAVDQYVWSPVYIDAMIERDRSVSGGTLNERLYVQQDANWNVTAEANSTGTVLEREVYDPYGSATFLAATWTTDASSAYLWIYLDQGGRFDIVSGLYYRRNRDESPALGRWSKEDPTRFAGGDVNLYRTEADAPATYLDPSGNQPPEPAPAPHPAPAGPGGGCPLTLEIWPAIGPVVDKYGTFAWAVDFMLSEPAPCAGVIAQHITFTINNGFGTNRSDGFEFWDVAAGRRDATPLYLGPEENFRAQGYPEVADAIWAGGKHNDWWTQFVSPTVTINGTIFRRPAGSIQYDAEAWFVAGQQPGPFPGQTYSIPDGNPPDTPPKPWIPSVVQVGGQLVNNGLALSQWLNQSKCKTPAVPHVFHDQWDANGNTTVTEQEPGGWSTILA